MLKIKLSNNGLLVMTPLKAPPPKKIKKELWLTDINNGIQMFIIHKNFHGNIYVDGLHA